MAILRDSIHHSAINRVKGNLVYDCEQLRVWSLIVLFLQESQALCLCHRFIKSLLRTLQVKPTWEQYKPMDIAVKGNISFLYLSTNQNMVPEGSQLDPLERVELGPVMNSGDNQLQFLPWYGNNRYQEITAFKFKKKLFISPWLAALRRNPSKQSLDQQERSLIS